MNKLFFSPQKRILFAIAAAVILLSAVFGTSYLSVAFSEATNFPLAVSVLLFALLFAALIIGGSVLIYTKLLPFYVRRERKDQKSYYDLLAVLTDPAVVCDSDGIIQWSNDAFLALDSKDGRRFGIPLLSIIEEGSKGLVYSEEIVEGEIKYAGRVYHASSYPLKTEKKFFSVIIFRDISEERQLRRAYDGERAVVAFIKIDNLDDTLMFQQNETRKAEADTNDLLKKWADELGGILRTFERNKYLLIMPNSALKLCMENSFSILDRVREIRLDKSGTSVTISIGVGAGGKTFSDREIAASDALRTALERGGDQTIVKMSDSVNLLSYGGTTNSAPTTTKVRARTNANNFCRIICESSNVLICGHRGADYDCIGAAVGMARVAMYCGVKVNIIIDQNDANTKKCIPVVEKIEEYQEGVFISPDEAVDLITSDTLLLFVDVNNPASFLCPEIVPLVPRIAFIDHHRKTAREDNITPLQSYIEISASSASELVSEMIEQCLPPRILRPQEATLLLAGIELDTKNFSKATSARTFGAAQYLRKCGANSEICASLFSVAFEDMKAEASFLQSAVIYKRSGITAAIAHSDKAGTVSAARVADKLLEMHGIDASFTLYISDERIGISARSKDRVNVQLILEELGGGGKFNAAGASLSDITLEDAEIKLREVIDKSFDALSEKLQAN